MIRKIIHIGTKERIQFCNITEDVQNFLDENKIKSGVVTVRTLHTTSAIYINENESGLLEDLTIFLSKLFPDTENYHHDDFSKRNMERDDEYKDRKNGFAHLQAMLMGHDITVSVIDGKLTLGRWQFIFFLEFDGPRKDRKIELLVYNEEKYD